MVLKENNRPEVPDDLNVKFGSKEEKAWTTIKDTQEETIRNSEINIAIAKKILILANDRIRQEKETFK